MSLCRPTVAVLACLLTLAACAGTPPADESLEEVVEVVSTVAPGEDAPRTETGSLTFVVPDGWESMDPQSAMRKAQFELAGADGAPPTQLVVFHFGGDGGGIDANIDRWIAQFSQDDGRSSQEVGRVSRRDVAGMPLHVLDITGRFVAETRPGSGERVDLPNSRMLAAILATDQGSYFVKLVGPRETVDHWAESFHAYLDSARPVIGAGAN